MSIEQPKHSVICLDCGELLMRREDGVWITLEGHLCVNDDLHDALGTGAGWFE